MKNLLRGAGSVFNVMPNPKEPGLVPPSPEEQIRRAWEDTGRAMYEALGRFGDEWKKGGSQCSIYHDFPPRPEKYEYDVFLSYASGDRLSVRLLAERLKKDGLRVWFDEWMINLGDSIPQAVEVGLYKSRVLVLVMSKHLFKSDWAALERHTVIFRDPVNRDRRFIPLLLEDCELPYVVEQYRHLDYRDKSDKAYQQLLTACTRRAN